MCIILIYYCILYLYEWVLSADSERVATRRRSKQWNTKQRACMCDRRTDASSSVIIIIIISISYWIIIIKPMNSLRMMRAFVRLYMCVCALSTCVLMYDFIFEVNKKKFLNGISNFRKTHDAFGAFARAVLAYADVYIHIYVRIYICPCGDCVCVSMSKCVCMYGNNAANCV